MANRSIGKSRKDAGSIDGTSKAINWKRKRTTYSSESESEEGAQIVKLGPGRSRRNDILTQETSIKKRNESRTMVFEKNISSSSEAESDSEVVENKPKNVRKRFSDKQVQVLLAVFNETPFPTKEQRKKLAEDTDHSIRQVDRWFDNRRAHNRGMVQSRPGRKTKEQKSRLKEVFAGNRYPDEKTVAALVAEIELSKVQVKQYFAKQRFDNPIPVCSEEETKSILMEYFQEDSNFHDHGNPELREKTGWSRLRMSIFFENLRNEYGNMKMDKTRYDSLKAFLKKETSLLPNEMETFEKLVEKYCLNLHEDPDLILYIEWKENVDGDALAQYLMDRSFVLEMLENQRAIEVVEQEKAVFADPNDAENANMLEFDHMNDDDGTVRENSQQDVKDIPLLGSSREENQKPPMVNRAQNKFDDFPEEAKNVPLFAPAPGHRDQSQEQVENAEENDVKPHREDCDRIQAQYFRK
ncbi:hypothetical protein B9Z55_023320 [Caenorhabditis nigoni]|uniref:Homeobox domain-containing protein n=1 Tax=Caenorhabditis nigoni TaxID=1611254 RepID=A0A2G5SPN3_9PELO|nr:hypothetical protein B9Z55_023320 [Caenorhabditis nigoni]